MLRMQQDQAENAMIGSKSKDAAMQQQSRNFGQEEGRQMEQADILADREARMIQQAQMEQIANMQQGAYAQGAQDSTFDYQNVQPQAQSMIQQNNQILSQRLAQAAQGGSGGLGMDPRTVQEVGAAQQQNQQAEMAQVEQRAQTVVAQAQAQQLSRPAFEQMLAQEHPLVQQLVKQMIA